MKVVIKVADYYQEHLPESERTSHFEVRQNFGSTDSPYWQTIKDCDTQEEANGYQ